MADFLMDILEKPILHVEKLGDCQTDDSIDSQWEGRIEDNGSQGSDELTPDASPMLDSEYHFDSDFDIAPNFFPPLACGTFTSPASDSGFSEDEAIFGSFPTSAPSPPTSVSDFDMSLPNHSFTQLSDLGMMDLNFDIPACDYDSFGALLPETHMPVSQADQQGHLSTTNSQSLRLMPTSSPTTGDELSGPLHNDQGNKKGRKAGKVACEICGKEFVNDWGVRRHTATAHPDPNTRNYRCDKTLPGGGLCTYKTYRHDHLLIHYKKHRGKH